MLSRTALLLVVALAAACGGSDPQEGPAPAGGEDERAGAFLVSLPPWPEPAPDAQGAVSAAESRYLDGTTGQAYRCEVQRYALTRTPEKIVTLNPNVQLLWPGGLLQGKALAGGRLAGLPIRQRAPLTVSIPTLLAPHNAITVERPDLASVQQAIGTLVSEAVEAGVRASSSMTYQLTESHSASQTALSLGLSASYLGLDLGARLGLSESADLHTVVGSFVQKMFTVAVPEPQRPGDLFEGLTGPDVDDLVAAGMLGPDNLPVYVAAVTYGRVMMFSVTSSASTREITAALNAQYNGVASGGVAASYAQLLSNASTTFRVVTVGGDAADAEAMIRSGDPSRYFSSDPLISTGVPISYALRAVRDNTPAAVSETTSYDVRTCVETAPGAGANVYVANGNGRVLAFDSDGTPVSLTTPIDLGGAANLGGAAYASIGDRLYFLDMAGYIEEFTPDGAHELTMVEAYLANWLSYDVRHDRLLVTTGGNVFGFTPDGLRQDGHRESLFTPRAVKQVVAHPYSGLLYAADAVSDAMRVFDAFGVETTAPGGFPGLLAPTGIAHDPHHDRFHVANLGDGTSGPFLAVYDGGGSLLRTTPLPSPVWDLAFDPVEDRVLATAKVGVVLAFSADGEPLRLRDGAFPGLADPRGIAFRP